MNAGLKAFAEATGRDADSGSMWQSVIRMLPVDRAVDAAVMTAAMHHAGLHLPRGEWTAILRSAGVLDARGWIDPLAMAAVSAALPSVALEISCVDASSWRLVATLPAGLGEARRGPDPLARTDRVIFGLLNDARLKVMMTAPFTDRSAATRLAEPLLECGRRGVAVIVLTSAGRGRAFAPVADRWQSVARSGVEFRCLEGTAAAGGGLGSHAKVVLVDGLRAYVGSANFTAAGMSRQFEVGALIEGGQMDRLTALLDRLARSGVTVAEAVGDQTSS